MKIYCVIDRHGLMLGHVAGTHADMKGLYYMEPGETFDVSGLLDDQQLADVETAAVAEGRTVPKVQLTVADVVFMNGDDRRRRTKRVRYVVAPGDVDWLWDMPGWFRLQDGWIR